jgi:hypothetical protein
MKIRTWHFESAFVAIALTTVIYLFGQHWHEWIGALAVWLTFGYISIAFRLQEAEEERQSKAGDVMVDCHWKAKYYFLGKELTWLPLFAILGSYTSMAGVFIFLAYPYWRRWWVSRRRARQAAKTS